MTLSARYGLLAAAALLTGAAAEPPASSIRFNQVGFEPAGPKRFVVASSRPVAWVLRTAAGDPVVDGTARPALDPGSGESVVTITIDRPLQPGRYTLVANGVNSRSITIAPRPFAPLFRDAMGFFYQQRAGTPILAAHVQRADLARPAGHPHEIATCFTGKDMLGTVWPGCGARVDVTGGWYDAGDHGKYVVNAGISVWTLLNAYERTARRDDLMRDDPMRDGPMRDGLMRDGALALPEANNAVPDLLDEARYEIEWLLRMQVRAGTKVAVLDADGKTIRRIDGGGLAWHKVADTSWTGLPMAPQNDRVTRALYPPSTAATFNLAAVAAQAARIWRSIDPAFSRRCLDAARRAYAAGLREPALFADARFDGSGGYGDRTIADERFWAAAELAVTAGDADALAEIARSPFGTRGVPTSIGWADTATLGAISLLAERRGMRGRVSPALVATQRRAVLAGADRLLDDAARQPYRLPTAPGPTQWGSNGGILNRAILLATAHDMTGDARYRIAVTDALDYVLGRNPLDRSYVTGYGARPMRNPHHRFWAHAIDPSYPAPPPGVLSGGPNSSVMTDPVATTMRGKCRPLTCWSDDALAFTQNEVALNWNAPLVWVTAFLDRGPGGGGRDDVRRRVRGKRP